MKPTPQRSNVSLRGGGRELPILWSLRDPLTHAGSHLHDGAVVGDPEKVFKALADSTRRYLLDTLRERNGQTLGELCDQLHMARQSASQHLNVLESANLISTVRRGREKLHYLNPVPLHEIHERWIDKFEQPRLGALSAIKRRAQEHAMTDKPSSSTSLTSKAHPRGCGRR